MTHQDRMLNPAAWSAKPDSPPPQSTAATAKRSFPVRTKPIADWLDAEKIAEAWMFALGFVSAKATPGGADAGVDVRAPRMAIAQVKLMQSVIGRREIQLLVGSRHPKLLEKTLFFSRSAYHPTAVQWANLWDVALFRFDDFGNPFPENQAARDLCRASGYNGWHDMTPPSDKWVSRDTARLRRELILSSTGNPVRTSPSAMLAIKGWAVQCGYTDAIRPIDEPELVTAKGLAILASFRGDRINALDIGKVAGIPGERVRVVVSWLGFTKGAKRAANERSVALLKCSQNGVLTDVNEAAVLLFAS